MFTGIVQGQAELISVEGDQNLRHFHFQFPDGSLEKVQKGGSIAINGTCLTVTGFDSAENKAQFDAIAETLKLTNLSTLKVGDFVNFERAAKIGDEIGGHLMSGHIHSCVTINKILKSNENCSVYFQLEEACKPYILAKGFVGLNGCSLTVGEVSEDFFNVHLIPETLEITTFGRLKIGDKVNLEIDSQTQAIVDTVERYMALQKHKYVDRL